MKIRSIHAYQVYDSRGNPTVEAEIELEAAGMAAAQSLRAPQPDSSKHTNCAMATPPDSAASQCSKPLPTFIVKLPRHSSDGMFAISLAWIEG